MSVKLSLNDLDLTLMSNYGLLSEAINNFNYDALNLNTGYEGVGKSTLSLWQNLIVDHDFNIDNCAFTSYELWDILKGAGKGQVVWADEGASILFARDSSKFENKSLIQLLAIIRKKNLFFNVNFPNIMLADKYVREHRITCKCNVERRGIFKLYIPIRNHDDALKWNTYPNAIGRFSKITGKLWNDYEKKKAKYIKDKIKVKTEKIDGRREKSELEEKTYNIKEVAKLENRSATTIRTWLRTGKIKTKSTFKHGKTWRIYKNYKTQDQANERKARGRL